MMVLRECVRRHGRFPQNLVVDGGKEFESVYFDTLLARFECIKKTRPPAKARFGSVCERLFGTFVVDNKSAILWRSPLCGVQPDEAAWSGLRGLERHITGEGQRLCKNAMSPLSLDQDLMGFDAGGSQRAMAFAFVSRSILA